MEGHRAERVTEAIREELAEIISYEMSDPRVSNATVTEVHVSPDLRPKREEAEPALQALEKAKGFLKRELSRRLDIFRVPDLHFEADIGTQIGDRMDFLFRRIKRGRPRDGEKAETGPSKSAPSPESDS